MTNEPTPTNWLERVRLPRPRFTALLLMLAAWVLYWPSAHYGFVNYDDIRILRDHPELYGQPTLAADLHAIFAANFPREEPLLVRDVSWALDSRLFGFGFAPGYHLINVLLHGVVVALMYTFLLGTTRRQGFALAVAVAYLVIAIHTEPVAWIMGRKDILSGLFVLLALCAQTRRLAATSLGAQAGWFTLTLACFVVGLLSKISVLAFPLVLWLHAILLPYLNGERPADGAFPWERKLVRESLLAVPSLGISLLVYGWYHRILDQMGIFDRGYTAHGLGHLWNLLMIDPAIILAYVQETFFPWQLTLFHSWPMLQPTYSLSQIINCLAGVVILAAIGIWLFCRHKDLFFYFATFFIIMVPYLNLVIPGILVADRYLYLSAFCLLALAVSAGGYLLRRPESWVRSGTAVLGLVFLGGNLWQTFYYQPAWRSAESLWEYHMTLPQPSPIPYANLASYYYFEASRQANTPGMAVNMQKMAIVVDAGIAQFWPDQKQPPPAEIYNLFFMRSLIQEVGGEPEAALASLLTADQLHPRFDSINLNLANLYKKLAATAKDTTQRDTDARAARDRYALYVELTYRGRPAPENVQLEMAKFNAACAATNLPPEKSKAP